MSHGLLFSCRFIIQKRCEPGEGGGGGQASARWSRRPRQCPLTQWGEYLPRLWAARAQKAGEEMHMLYVQRQGVCVLLPPGHHLDQHARVRVALSKHLHFLTGYCDAPLGTLWVCAADGFSRRDGPTGPDCAVHLCHFSHTIKQATGFYMCGLFWKKVHSQPSLMWFTTYFVFIVFFHGFMAWQSKCSIWSVYSVESQSRTVVTTRSFWSQPFQLRLLFAHCNYVFESYYHISAGILAQICELCRKENPKKILFIF